MNDPIQHIGERIRAKRNSANLKVEELAQKAGVSKAYISQLENGTSTKPSANKLYDIAAALGTSMADLLGKKIPKAEVSDDTEIPRNLLTISKTLNINDSVLRRMVMVQNRQGDSLNDVSEEKWVNLFFALKQIDDETVSQ